MSTEQVILSITEGRTALGIEFGSTRIKAVLTDETTAPIAQGSHQWENRLVNNIWTYMRISCPASRPATGIWPGM